jgi:hypothetical protein
VASFSAGQAIGSGFRLIGREPKAVAVWVGAYAVFALLMYGAMVAFLPEILGMFQTLGRNAEPDPDLALSLLSRLFALLPILLLIGLLSYSVMLGAIYRAILDPTDRRFLYLRFGRSELWLLLTLVVFWIFLVVVSIAVNIVVSIPAAIAGAALAAAGGDPGGATAIILLSTLLGSLLTAWIALRLSLALPMSHVQKRFVMFESWKLSRGQSLKMLAVACVLILILFAIELVALAVFTALLTAATGLGGLDAIVAAAPEDLSRRLLPWLPVLGLVASALAVLMFVVLATPIADIYRQLKGPAAPGVA